MAGAEHAHFDPSKSIEGHHHLTRNIDEGFDPLVLKRIIRKVDLRLIPILSAMYCISLIDRTNLSLARAANNKAMDTRLQLSIGDRYTMATVMFFPPYILLEMPSQIGLRKFGARWWLGTSVILWGIVMIGMGFVTTWNQLTAVRAILGVFEATLFPGAAYLIACWYPRKEMAVRNVAFYVISIVVSGLSATLAYGLSTLHLRNGLEGWQWIFVIEGIITVGIGLLGYLLITDFPDKAKFLTDDERDIIQLRIERDRGDAVADTLNWKKFTKYICEPRLWIYGYMFGSSTVGSYSLAYFLPQILATMGFTNVQAQLLVAPPYVWAAIPALSSAFLADNVRNCRSVAVAFNATCVIVGTAMYSQLPLSQKAARYAGVFIALGGCNSNVPLILSWAQTSIRSQSKRGFTSALIVAWGGIGGIIASVAFIQKEAKDGYPTGVFLTIGMNAAVVACAVGLNLFYNWQNKRAARGEVILEGEPEFRYQG
ncbi:uncharacterized protein COLE_06668 [Cutaneotrichosporon oleaginosum]|nr:hypothetical protein COLE_06668 [Cutaneotrichosporon oleaginosum]